MRIPCDAYIEPWTQGARAGRAQSSLRPAVAKHSSVAVDRDEARDVCLFVGKSPGNKPHLVCRVDDVVDIDARQVTDGIVGIRFSAPPVLLLVYNTRALLLEDFVRLLRKLTERRKIGTAVRFRYTPEQVLDSQRIEREQAAAVSTLQASSGVQSATVPASVANAMGSLYASAARSATHAAHPPTRTSLQTSPSSRSGEGAGRQSAFEEPLKTALDGEIDGLRRAMASESRDRGSLMDRIARLERENSYLNAQLQMEQKKQGDYREATREAQKLAEEAEIKMKDKQRELHDRTEELIEERHGRQDMMEEGLRRMQEVESYTVTSMQHVRSMQRRVAGMMAQRLDIRVLIHAVRRWRSQTTSVMGRMELLRMVHQRFVYQVLGRPLMSWRKQADLVLYLSTALPRLALRRRRNLLALVFRSWQIEAWRSARAKMLVTMGDLKAAVEREQGLAAQLREAEEMLAEAYAAQNDVEKAVRDQTQRGDREVQEARDLMEAAQIEERRVRAQLEEVTKELKALKSAEHTTRTSLAEHVQSHKQETEVLRERLRAAESAFDSLKRKLNESQARQQDLEDMVSKKEGLASDKNVKIEMLQQTVKELEAQSGRLLQQLQSEEASRARAEGARQSMQAKLEELERSGSVIVRGRQAVQTEYDDERKRRAQLEDALAKLIKAFKEAKEEHRQKLTHAGEYVRMLAAFFEWRRTAELSAQAAAHDTLDYRRQELQALSSVASAEKASLSQSAHEMRELRDAVQHLSAELEDSREREEQARASCASLEAQLASLKETYLKGVKASVESIRQCRDKYLPANASNAEAD